MTVARFPQLAHWGAFTALVEDGRVVGCEPFAQDPAPSNMLDAIPEMVHSPLRIARPAIREGWREGKERTGADRFREVSWEEALATVASELARVRETFGHTAILGGSYGWSSAGRVHHARGFGAYPARCAHYIGVPTAILYLKESAYNGVRVGRKGADLQ